MLITNIPAGAFCIIAKLPGDDSERLVQWLPVKYIDNGETVMCAPAKDFYMTKSKGVDEVRIAYVLSVPKLRRAMELLKNRIEEYKKNNIWHIR